MTNKVFKRFSEIAQNKNTDSSDEYYTLYHSYMALFLELICRHRQGKTYKVIICPCDSESSVFRNTDKLAHLIGGPRVIYSSYPEKNWEDYFDMDYQSVYGVPKEEVCIFTNPPFKNLSSNIRKIKCDYLLFGSNAVSIREGVYVKNARVSLYIKNNENYNGNADQFEEKYGNVSTWFYSNEKFLSEGEQYFNKTNKGTSILFGKDKLTKVKKGEKNEN